MRLVRLLPWLLVVGCGGAPAGIAVPRAPVAPRLDGDVAPAEWQGAVEIPLGAGRAKLARDEHTLYVALTGDGAGIATVYLALGDQVLALHASAALGTAAYRRGAAGEWECTRDFVWECRDPSDAPPARACRGRFFAADHWLANVRPDHGANRELAIDLDALGSPRDAPLRLVLVYYVYPGGVAAWPPDVGDDTLSEDLLRGSPPARARFALERWGRVGW